MFLGDFLKLLIAYVKPLSLLVSYDESVLGDIFDLFPPFYSVILCIFQVVLVQTRVSSIS